MDTSATSKAHFGPLWSDFRGRKEKLYLRHVSATNALEHGMDIKTLSTIIGYVSSATTLNVYAHMTDGMKEQAARIDQGIGKAEPSTGIARQPLIGSNSHKHLKI